MNFSFSRPNSDQFKLLNVDNDIIFRNLSLSSSFVMVAHSSKLILSPLNTVSGETTIKKIVKGTIGVQALLWKPMELSRCLKDQKRLEVCVM